MREIARAHPLRRRDAVVGDSHHEPLHRGHRLAPRDLLETELGADGLVALRARKDVRLVAGNPGDVELSVGEVLAVEPARMRRADLAQRDPTAARGSSPRLASVRALLDDGDAEARIEL